MRNAKPRRACRDRAGRRTTRSDLELAQQGGNPRRDHADYLLAAARGRMVDGAEAELQAAAGVSGHGIPLELWDVPTEQRSAEGERETRAITPAPGTVGVNLDPIRPAVFANSIAPRLGIEMPRVASGTYASATITTSQSAAAYAKIRRGGWHGLAAITVTTATPKRVSRPPGTNA